MTKKTDTEQPKGSEPTEAQLKYDTLNKQFSAENDPVKRAELDKQCQEAFVEKLKSRDVKI